MESCPSTATVTRAFKIFLAHATRRRYHRADGASWEVPADRESFRKRLGETIREARRRLGMRQEDLAREAGFEHLQTVSDIERGQREVHAYELVRISTALGLQVADLLHGRLPPMPAVLWRNPPAREDRRRAEEARFLGPSDPGGRMGYRSLSGRVRSPSRRAAPQRRRSSTTISPTAGLPAHTSAAAS